MKSPFSVANFRRLGYSQDEVNEISDRMVDDLVFWGDPASVAQKLKGHLEAGADHVAIQVIGRERGASPVQHLDRLAEILHG
jgi:alkanesulfonate monooxygenase SsuD/methylene tetrahydromethanopterin reductase-like flavin-dependent oxidoreductase (luciferase family)